jgi:hypothetical protein
MIPSSMASKTMRIKRTSSDPAAQIVVVSSTGLPPKLQSWGSPQPSYCASSLERAKTRHFGFSQYVAFLLIHGVGV